MARRRRLFTCPICNTKYSSQQKSPHGCSPRCARLFNSGAHLPLGERFARLIQKTDNCWLWAGQRTGGYGVFNLAPLDVTQIKQRGKWRIYAHRFSYIIHSGPIPHGLCVCHNCPGGDNPLCVNPDHLFLGTKADNNYDRDKKGRRNDALSAARRRGQKVLKVSNAKVREARKKYEAGGSPAVIARELNIGYQNLLLIISHRSRA